MMTDEHEPIFGPIEDGIPAIPSLSPPGRKSMGLASRLRAIDAGQSFTLPKRKRNQLMTAIRRECVRSEGATFQVPGEPYPRLKPVKTFAVGDAENGRLRVWRTA